MEQANQDSLEESQRIDCEKSRLITKCKELEKIMIKSKDDSQEANDRLKSLLQDKKSLT
jgi:hypothetical protein